MDPPSNAGTAGKELLGCFGRFRGGFLLCPGLLLLGGWLPVDLLDVVPSDLQNELLFARLVKLDHDMLVGAGYDGTRTELCMFHLGAGGEGRFAGHFL